jgi:membrane associated rhomboid family serine protease
MFRMFRSLGDNLRENLYTFRSRGENLHSIYILLFLNFAFFFLQIQDPQRYMQFFCFDREAILHGHELWRLFTFQFVQGGTGLFFMSPPVMLFLNCLFLYLLGSAVEDEWGTKHFLIFYGLSVAGSGAVGFVINQPILGSFFLSYSLVFAYATLYPEATFYFFFVIPVRARMLGWVAFMALLAGVVLVRSPNSMSALGGAALSYGYFWLERLLPVRRPRSVGAAMTMEKTADRLVQTATRNLSRTAAVKNALATTNDAEIDRLIALSESEITRGVNICPPPDYKPEASDGYCVRCDGFAECTARYLRLNRPQKATGDAVAPIETT